MYVITKKNVVVLYFKIIIKKLNYKYIETNKNKFKKNLWQIANCLQLQNYGRDRQETQADRIQIIYS